MRRAACWPTSRTSTGSARRIRTCAAYSSAEFADEASVEAQAYEGLLDALDGRLPVGRTAVQKSLDEARKMKRVALEARSSVHLARILLRERRPREAVTALSQISVEMLGLEFACLSTTGGPRRWTPVATYRRDSASRKWQASPSWS